MLKPQLKTRLHADAEAVDAQVHVLPQPLHVEGACSKKHADLSAMIDYPVADTQLGCISHRPGGQVQRHSRIQAASWSHASTRRARG